MIYNNSKMWNETTECCQPLSETIYDINTICYLSKNDFTICCCFYFLCTPRGIVAYIKTKINSSDE